MSYCRLHTVHLYDLELLRTLHISGNSTIHSSLNSAERVRSAAADDDDDDDEEPEADAVEDLRFGFFAVKELMIDD